MFMKKISLCLFLMAFFTISVMGQPSSKDDAQAYEMYLSKTFAKYYPISVLQRIYKYMDVYSKDSALLKDRYVLTDEKRLFDGNAVSADHAAEGPILCYTPTIMVGKGQNHVRSDRHYDDRAFPDTLRYVFKMAYNDYRSKYPKKRVAQDETITLLKSFDQNSENKPLFFADIHQVYHDDIDAYVKDIFSKSLLVSDKQNQRFLRKPSAEKLKNDIGVRFVIGVALYKLWLTQQTNK